MQTESEHLAQAISNEKFLNDVDDARFPDWAVTVAFYTSLHLVNRVTARDEVNISSHSDRNKYLMTNYRPLWKLYEPVYILSIKARYICGHTTVNDADKAKRLLKRIDTEVERILKTP